MYFFLWHGFDKSIIIVNQKTIIMKASFIKLDAFDETEDGFVIINANNISSIKRLNYNDMIQTMVLMIGGERFGVHQTPDEIIELTSAAEREHSRAEAYH